MEYQLDKKWILYDAVLRIIKIKSWEKFNLMDPNTCLETQNL